MSAAKSKRIKFSEEEKFLILEEFSLRKDILIPKSGRYKNTVVRQRAWEEIAAAVNSLSPLVQRTPDEIRRKWDNMVLDARRELAVEKHPLLRQRPREKLFRNIFALLNAPGPAPPLPAAVLGARAAGGAPDPPALPGTAPHRLPPGQSRAAAPGRGPLRAEGSPPAPGPAPQSPLGAAGGEPGPAGSLLPAGPRPGAGERPPSPGAAPGLPPAEPLPAPAPPPASPRGRAAAGPAPVPPAGSPEPPAPFRIKRPPSPAPARPRLGVTASPATRSGGTAGPGAPAPAENGRLSVPEGSPPGPWGCLGTAREQWEKQSWLQRETLELQRETLELQKETLQLQKEKILLEKENILLEKEKLLLEIIKLRRELGT